MVCNPVSILARQKDVMDKVGSVLAIRSSITKIRIVWMDLIGITIH